MVTSALLFKRLQSGPSCQCIQVQVNTKHLDSPTSEYSIHEFPLLPVSESYRVKTQTTNCVMCRPQYWRIHSPKSSILCRFLYTFQVCKTSQISIMVAARLYSHHGPRLKGLGWTVTDASSCHGLSGLECFPRIWEIRLTSYILSALCLIGRCN